MLHDAELLAHRGALQPARPVRAVRWAPLGGDLPPAEERPVLLPVWRAPPRRLPPLSRQAPAIDQSFKLSYACCQ